MTSVPPVFGLTDLAKRWQRSAEYVRLHMRDADAFPAAAGSINGGRNRFWLVSDLVEYERLNPSVMRDGRPAETPKPNRTEARDEVASAHLERPVRTLRSLADVPRNSEAEIDEMVARMQQHRRTHPPKKQRVLSPGHQAAAERLLARDEARREGRPVVSYMLAFRFEKKPPFALRETFKKDGWKYVPSTREWIAKVLPEDADDYRRAFAEAGATKTVDTALYDTDTEAFGHIRPTSSND